MYDAVDVDATEIIGVRDLIPEIEGRFIVPVCDASCEEGKGVSAGAALRQHSLVSKRMEVARQGAGRRVTMLRSSRKRVGSFGKEKNGTDQGGLQSWT